MSFSALLIRLGLALLVAYVLGTKSSAAENANSDGPTIDIAPPPILAQLASADPLPVATPAPVAATPTEPAATPVVTTTPAPTEAPSQPAATAPEPTPAPAPVPEVDASTLLARESAVLKQAEKKVLEREAQIVDPIRELLLREATLITAATAHKTETKSAPVVKFDRVSMAEKLVLANDFRMAVTLLRNIESSAGVSEEERARAQLLLAKIDLHQGRPTDAVVKLSAWLAEFPRRRESPFVYYLLGQCYRDLGVYELARDNFYRVMSGTLMAVANSDDPSYASEKKLVRAAVWQLAETEYMHQNWERALTYFDRFYSQNPSGDQLVEASLYRKADCQYQLRQNPAAIANYEKALAVAPFHPFAPEAWLRLYFLYGASHQPQKQAEAMQALTWVVKNLQPNRLAYWQQRAVSMVMELPLENRTQLVTLRDGLRNRADDPSWKTLYGYLDDMCSRLTLIADREQRTPREKPPQAGAPQSADEFVQWKNDYTRKRDQLQEQAKSLLKRQPVGDSVKPRGVPTQG